MEKGARKVKIAKARSQLDRDPELTDIRYLRLHYPEQMHYVRKNPAMHPYDDVVKPQKRQS